MNFEDFSSLHVLKVHLPFLRVLARLVHLGLQISDLVLGELLQSAHDLFDAGHLLSQRVVRQTSVLDGLLLQGVHFVDLFPKGALEEALPLVD